MKEIVVFKFKVFDKSIKEKAMEIATEFPGVTSVIEIEGEGQLEVRGEFDKFALTKELKQIDESVDIFKIARDAEEVNKPPKANIFGNNQAFYGRDKEEMVKPPPGDAGSSYWPRLEPYGLWEKAKYAAEQAKVVGVGAVKQAQVVGVGAVKQAQVVGVGAVEQAKAAHAGVAKYMKKREQYAEQCRANEWHKKEDRNQRNAILKRVTKEAPLKKDTGQTSATTRDNTCTAHQSGTTRNQTGFTESLKNTLSSLTPGQTTAPSRDNRSTQTNRCCCKGCNPSKN